MKNTIKRAISILTVMSVLTMINIQSTVKAATSFSDVKSTAWYYDYVNRLVDLKITSGTGNNKFSPNDSVTRAEFVTFLCKVKGYEQTKGDPFVDTQKHWSTGYVTIALNNGIMDLPKDKKFKPNTAITRLEAVEMMCRALGIKSSIGTTNPYTDVKPTDTGYTNAAYINYLMVGSIDSKGKKVFKPSDKLTRGEVASLIVNAYNYNLNRIGFLNDKATEEYEKQKAEQEKAAQEQLEKQKYQSWLNTLDKGVSVELLKNTVRLTGGKSVYESHQTAIAKMKEGYWDAWAESSNVKGEQFAHVCLDNARKAVDIYYNMDYKKSDDLKNQWEKIMSTNFNYAYAERYLNDLKNNTTKMEGYFYTGYGLVTYNENGQPSVRGTVKYRYLSPSKVPQGKKLNTWYEDDIRLCFYPEDTGLMVASWTELSPTRTVK